jgi:hypothetical protein
MESASFYRRSSVVVLHALLAVWLLCGVSNAQFNYGDKAEEDLADASSGKTIPPGTVVSKANWQQYRAFMPVGLQALFSGQYQFHMGDGPDYTVKVYPTSDIRLPAAYRKDTEKYGGQARLKPSKEGGYVYENYTAGVPFPSPSEPLIGEKILYNAFLSPAPVIVYFWFLGRFVDRYGNSSVFSSASVRYKLSFNSDPPYPVNLPWAGEYFKSLSSYVSLPEQSKYTAALDLLYKDPDHPQESYVFLPSLRRSLRLSSAARCSPILGTDWVQDDNGGIAFLVGHFKVKYLGKKKLLTIANYDWKKAAETKAATVTALPLPGWILPDIARWELRDIHVIDVTPIQPNYCYSHRVQYIDAKLWNVMYYDLYDQQGKLWKTNYDGFYPYSDSKGESTINPYFQGATIWDVQNSHCSSGFDVPPLGIDEQAPQQYQDIQTMAFPAGLSTIMK